MHAPDLNERLAELPRVPLFSGNTALEPMPNLTNFCDGAKLFVKRDDCTELAFGGNKVRQLEFYLGEAQSRNADTILITGAVQSNFVRLAAAAACKTGMDCHIQLEERVARTNPDYRNSGNVFIDKILGATIHSYPEGEDESGADRQLEQIAEELLTSGHRPYVIPLGPGHPPLGAAGYVAAACELLEQIDNSDVTIDRVFVGSGSGATHGGLLFGLRALGSDIRVTGVCVRRNAELQRKRIHNTCVGLAKLLQTQLTVSDEDICLIDAFLAPGYGVPNAATLDAIAVAARCEGLLVDPVYTGKVFAAVIYQAQRATTQSNFLFLHTGGSPALFAYEDVLSRASVPAPPS